jgi:hypothetical protein
MKWIVDFEQIRNDVGVMAIVPLGHKMARPAGHAPRFSSICQTDRDR